MIVDPSAGECGEFVRLLWRIRTRAVTHFFVAKNMSWFETKHLMDWAILKAN